MIKKLTKEEVAEKVRKLEETLVLVTKEMEAAASEEATIANEVGRISKSVQTYASKMDGLEREMGSYRNAILSSISRRPTSVQAHVRSVASYRQRATSLYPVVRKLKSKEFKQTARYKKANLKTMKLKKKVSELTKTITHLKRALE